MDASLHALLTTAQARRDAGEWEAAARLFRQADALAPGTAEIQHNLALVCFARGDVAEARTAAEQAVSIQPQLWQSHALLAKLHRAGGDPIASDAAWRKVLAASRGNGAALLGLADLAMNEFGDPQAALALVGPLARDPGHAADAELTALMALLYIGAADPVALTGRMLDYSRANLRLPGLPQRARRPGKRRVGVISPLFSASPVYYLGFGALGVLAAEHELVLFTRSTRRDWATERFEAIAAEWIDAAHIEPQALAERIHEAEIDILIDMGGWSDAAGLAALSAKPAGRMYKWVGGQSATTGLNMFDGWIGDEWQSPDVCQPFYAEPIVNMDGGYIDYTPPEGIAALRGGRQKGVALVGNPAKIGAATLAAIPAEVARVTLIDRRYTHARTRDRVTALLERRGIAVDSVIVPRNHAEYLQALARCDAMLNTAPYAAGLTAVEALALGVKLIAAEKVGPLFCARHHLSHLKTGGRNPRLAAQLLALVSA